MPDPYLGLDGARPYTGSGVPEPYFFLQGGFLVLQPPFAGFFAGMRTSLSRVIISEPDANG